MLQIDEAIGQVENLYRAVTGKEIPSSAKPYAPIPAEQDPSVHVKEQMERLLAALSEPVSQAAVHASRPWVPPISLFETSSELLVCVDLPGVSRERIDVTVNQGLLVIGGERTLQGRNVEGSRIVAEQAFGPFRRAVLLPGGLKTSEMNAQLKEGVLEVRIPRNGDAGARTVPVS